MLASGLHQQSYTALSLGICRVFYSTFAEVNHFTHNRAVTKGWELGISPGYYEHDPQLFL